MIKISLIIPVAVDEGALEILWYSLFENIEDIIQWWKEQESIDIYKYKTDVEAAEAILSNGKIVTVNTEEQYDLYYAISAKPETVTLMIDTDYTSCLSYKGKKYFHKGKLHFLPPPLN